jgi:hypothetical protein
MSRARNGIVVVMEVVTIIIDGSNSSSSSNNNNIYSKNSDVSYINNNDNNIYHHHLLHIIPPTTTATNPILPLHPPPPTTLANEIPPANVMVTAHSPIPMDVITTDAFTMTNDMALGSVSILTDASTPGFGSMACVRVWGKCYMPIGGICTRGNGWPINDMDGEHIIDVMDEPMWQPMYIMTLYLGRGRSGVRIGNLWYD